MIINQDQTTIAEFQKSQFIRVIDFTILGPFMIYAGIKLPSKSLQTIMITAGFLTITYNLNNYLKNKQST